MKNVSVIGIGRLGLCFSFTLEKSQHYNVIGCDINSKYVESINNKTLNSPETGVNEQLKVTKNFYATTNLEETIKHGEIIFITLRTESETDGKYDCSQIETFLQDLILLGKQKEIKHIVNCSNVNPGYTDSIYDRIKHLGYTVSFNPEWVQQGSILYNQSNPDTVVIGEHSKEVGDIIEEVYHNICKNTPSIHRMDRISGELTKLTLNCFLTVKISYANMMGDIITRTGGDIDAVLKAAGSDSRIGNKFFKYGFGYGGPCFPRDTRAMIYHAKSKGLEATLCKGANKINDDHLQFQFEEFVKHHDKKQPIHFDSVTYKEGVVIIEESQQLRLAVKLAEYGYSVIIRERKEVISQVKQIYGDLFYYVTI